ncbi:nucleoside hydrolase, partial [Microcoleus sp. AT9_B4]
KSPGILKKAQEIVMMGGAFFCSGNVNLHAEFNIWLNAEAAQTVFDSRNDIVVMPLDVTRHLIFTRDMTQAVTQANPESKLSQFSIALCEFTIGTALGYRETARIAGLLVRDAATLGYLFYPETLMLKRAKVRVETKSELTKNFKGGTRHAIEPWNQSKIENRKSSRKSIYLAQVNLKSKI